MKVGLLPPPEHGVFVSPQELTGLSAKPGIRCVPSMVL